MTTVKNVEYIPQCTNNLISVGKLEDEGVSLTVDSPKDISNKVFKALLSTPDLIKKKVTLAPILEAPLDVSNSKIKASRAQVELLQARLGHPGKQQEAELRKILKDLPEHSFCPSFCYACTQRKMTRNPSREKMRSVSAPLERVHMDWYDLGVFSNKQITSKGQSS